MKKKLFSLFLVLMICPSLLLVKKGFDKEKKGVYSLRSSQYLPPARGDNWDEMYNWEYLKNRFFDGKTFDIYRMEGPILFDVKGAKKEDSISIKNTINELRKLIPHKKIDFVENIYPNYKEEPNYSNKINPLIDDIIELHFNRKKTKKDSFRRFHNRYYIGNGNSIGVTDWINIGKYPFGKVQYSFINTISNKEKDECIRYGILRSLCKIKYNPDISGGVKYVGCNSIFASTNYSPLKSIITKEDIFLIHKLYSKNFKEEFKTYLFNSYSPLYAFAFFSPELYNKIVLILTLFIGLFFLVYAYNTLYKIRHKYNYLSYLLPLTIVTFGIYSIILFYKNMISFDSRFGIPSLSLYITIKYFLSPYFKIFIICGVISLFLWGFDYFFIKKNIHILAQISLSMVGAFLSFSICYLFIEFIGGSFKYFFFDYRIKNIHLILIIISFTLGRGVLIYLNHFSENLIKQKDIELSQLKEQNAQATVKLLQSQINPHFLYNALNSIGSLAPVNADKTQKMAYSLSNLFKYSIHRKGNNLSSIKDEITMVKNYLEIEQIRFGDRLNFKIEVEDSLFHIKIAQFIIQPLVENAIKHGISQIEENGLVILSINKTEEELMIQVEDNGPNFPDGLVSGHGLQTVYDLLRLTYDKKAHLNWQNSPKKSITIYLPNTKL